MVTTAPGRLVDLVAIGLARSIALDEVIFAVQLRALSIQRLAMIIHRRSGIGRRQDKAIRLGTRANQTGDALARARRSARGVRR
jgi:hypothetical protein